ncbi:DUF1622 domain-containing protein [Aureivirga sp. CE67]|uniref:DUF1622 domain-containing protein n=1 Tax=Aureivirga sp. CE67 TaxID=1788983 RepID=UPI0018CB791E|nr:DUF1622 domain-containing protein [Aureivirga sp. CE67]
MNNVVFEYLDELSDIVDVIGILILMFGFLKGIIELIKTEIKALNKKENIYASIQTLRSKVGLYILLALDFLIASDIIGSVVHKTQDELFKLAIVIVIRIVIGYFLSKEITEIREYSKEDSE